MKRPQILGNELSLGMRGVEMSDIGRGEAMVEGKEERQSNKS